VNSKKPETSEEYESMLIEEQKQKDDAIKALSEALHVDKIMDFLNRHKWILILACVAFIGWCIYLIMTNW